MRFFLDNSRRENQHTLYVQYFFPENMKKYRVARQATDDNIIRSLRTEYWKPKATNKHSEYVTLIALLRQRWLHERASMLRYTYTAYRVFNLSP